MSESLYEHFGYSTAPETFEELEERLRMFTAQDIDREIFRIESYVARGNPIAPDDMRFIAKLSTAGIVKLKEERDAVLQLAREYSHSGVNPGAHDLASKILKLLGDR